MPCRRDALGSILSTTWPPSRTGWGPAGLWARPHVAPETTTMGTTKVGCNQSIFTSIESLPVFPIYGFPCSGINKKSTWVLANRSRWRARQCHGCQLWNHLEFSRQESMGVLGVPACKQPSHQILPTSLVLCVCVFSGNHHMAILEDYREYSILLREIGDSGDQTQGLPSVQYAFLFLSHIPSLQQ